MLTKISNFHPSWFIVHERLWLKFLSFHGWQIQKLEIYYRSLSQKLINALPVYVTKFFMVIGFIFGAMFSFEALAGWISLFIAFKFQRTRNEKLSFLLAAIQTTGKIKVFDGILTHDLICFSKLVQTFYNYTDFWQSKNYFPREVNIILWGLCIYLTFVEVYWFFWVWYTVLIRGTVYRNRRQYKRGRFVVICGTVAHGIAEVVSVH